MLINEIINMQRSAFASGQTLPLSFRHSMLTKLKESIRAHEADICDALKADLGKSAAESYMCEVGLVLSELGYVDKHLDRWAKQKGVPSPIAQFHARSFTVSNPYGIVLIMSPWNYPFLLTIDPLIGALAAGNCCVVKPSAYSPATSAVMKLIIEECFPPSYVAVVEGGRAENQELLDQPFDYIFFTGGTNVGKEVLRRAAEHLTPVTLELGGKSPCVVDSTAKIPLAAKRIAFGKFLNCGQTCVAPDYILVDKSVEEELIRYLKKYLRKMTGQNPLQNENYVHMINRKHFDRVMGLIDPAKVVYGGVGDPETLRIAPTILQGVTADDAVMQEEIFGPIVPIITYEHIEEAIFFIEHRPHPLACYLFSEDKQLQERFLSQVHFGGGCINDTIIHLATSAMPFGGVGGSGMGGYHGKKSFETFSHQKSIVNKSTWMDMPLRYAPYNFIKDKIIHMFVK